jgi:hypothetical protein
MLGSEASDGAVARAYGPSQQIQAGAALLTVECDADALAVRSLRAARAITVARMRFMAGAPPMRTRNTICCS